MNTQTLDEKLRERGRQKLNEHLKRITKDFDVMCGTIESGLQMTKDGSRELGAASALDQLRRAVFAWHESKWTQKEVDDFLIDVRDMKTQLESLEPSGGE